MPLLFREFDIDRVESGSHSSLQGGVLTLAVEPLVKRLCSQDPRITSVSIDVARPGESTRIVCVKDVIQPRCKDPKTAIGTGTTDVLNGVAVVTCGPIVAFQEGIIDMSGDGAAYTPFSQMSLVAVKIGVASGISAHDHEAIVRSAGIDIAQQIAMIAAGQEPDRTRQILWDQDSISPSLPKIVYVDMLLSQGLLHDTYVLGHDAKEGLPRIVDPRIVLDGGIVSGNCVSACDKNTTYHHQNNPLIGMLLDGHGTRWNFIGMVLTNEPTRLTGKQDSANRTVELVRQSGAQGAILSKEGFGNPDADLMMIIKGLESAGIKTVAITDEYAGREGDSQSLADTTPQADAIVSTGNANQSIVLPPMERTIGPLPEVSRLAGGYPYSLRDDHSLEVELQAVIGSTNQLGFGKLSCRGI